MSSECPGFVVLNDSASADDVAYCELGLHHKLPHKAVRRLPTYGPRPQGGRARRTADVKLEWR